MINFTCLADFPGRNCWDNRVGTNALYVTDIRYLTVAHREQVLNPNTEKMIS